MQVKNIVFRMVIFTVALHGSCTNVFSQDIAWMKGLWKAYSGTPYQVPPVHCRYTLQIIATADSAFTGIQSSSFVTDTAVKIMYACSGTMTKNHPTFLRGAILYKKNSAHAGYAWNDCANCNAYTDSIYVADNKIIWLIKADNSGDSSCNGSIAYYRDLNDFNSTVQQQLLSFYTPKEYSSLTLFSTVNNKHKKTILSPEEIVTSTNDTTGTSTDSTLPLVLRERTNKLEQTLQINSPNIEVVLLDDAEIDGDIVSLYHNNVLAIDHKTLGKEVIKYSFKADKQHAHHELILVAENLGSIPPNTALMRIRAGDKKYELTTRANMHENAKVIIEYTGE